MCLNLHNMLFASNVCENGQSCIGTALVFKLTNSEYPPDSHWDSNPLPLNLSSGDSGGPPDSPGMDPRNINLSALK